MNTLSVILEIGAYVPGIVAIAAALAVFGAAWGIGGIGKSAMEAIARHPEAAGNVRSSMIIAGALVEGATLHALNSLCYVAESIFQGEFSNCFLSTNECNFISGLPMLFYDYSLQFCFLMSLVPGWVFAAVQACLLFQRAGVFSGCSS